MAQNYILLERIELNDTAASVTFSNIPQTGYTDLKVVWSVRNSQSSNTVTRIQFNGDTGSVYSSRLLYGNGSAASSYSETTTSLYAGDHPQSSYTANTFGNNEAYIPNYTSSVAKSVSIDGVSENNATAAWDQLSAHLWNPATQAAITSIKLFPASGNFVQYSTFSLYGIANANTTPAIAPKADGGNVIATDGTYWYHAFLSNGTFTPQVGLSCDVLTIAGGGGGSGGGGGGAGGLRNLVAQTFTTTGYAITVGAGGTAGVIGGAAPTAGVNSSIIGGVLSIASSGGGGGGLGSAVTAGANGGTGGSGGGGTFSSGATTVGGAGNSGGYTPVEGYAGGGNGGFTGSAYPGGGGGGAGGAGSSAPNNVIGGAGGIGVNTYSSWASATGTGVSGYFAGGGGGGAYIAATAGAGGAGGGGAGMTGITGASATSGTANTGGGGGGSGGTGSSGAGGSGIVIVRYTVA